MCHTAYHTDMIHNVWIFCLTLSIFYQNHTVASGYRRPVAPSSTYSYTYIYWAHYCHTSPHRTHTQYTTRWLPNTTDVYSRQQHPRLAPIEDTHRVYSYKTINYIIYLNYSKSPSSTHMFMTWLVKSENTV